MEYKDLFKSIGIPSLAESLAKRCESVTAERQEKRREFFWGARLIPEAAAPSKTETIVENNVRQFCMHQKREFCPTRTFLVHLHSKACSMQVERRIDEGSEKVESGDFTLFQWIIYFIKEQKKHTRADMLKKWKEEKMKRLEEAKKKKKPAFKVGVVQRKVTGSPVFAERKTYTRNITVNTRSQKKSQVNSEQEKKSGMLTRARARNMPVKLIQIEKTSITRKTQEKKFANKFYKIDDSKKKPVNSSTFKVPEVVAKLPCSNLTFPYSPKLTRKSKKQLSFPQLVATEVKPVESDQKSEKELSNENKVQTPEKSSAVEDDFRPIHYSPFVTVRSGKKPRRESKKKLTIDVDEQIRKEEKQMECRIFSFRKYIECETKRLLERCEKWKLIYEEFEEIPTDVEGDIDSAVGKTNLLTSDKFKQFGELIDKCENGDPFVKVDDLQGFQDWVSIEVERIDEEFSKLEKRKDNGWKQELPAVHLERKPESKPAKKGPKKPVGKSNIRSHILAARKLLKEGNGVTSGNIKQLPVAVEVGTEKVKSPRKGHSLLREVLDPETRTSSAKKMTTERRNSGLEIMIATQKNKFPTPVKLQKSPAVCDYEVLIGDDRTPNRSILRKSPKMSSSKARVTFKKMTENVGGGGRGLSEKYFQPLMDNDERSPIRTVLGDLGNLTPGGMKTRSRTRQLSYSASPIPQVQ